ncbi:TetR/AcrR family transcriptional regulator [Acidovorax sp. A1169]|uniref:TetR/AcrR family transcriptional regulator n=1 Tax=Acidovorax sp. A1169 TaxID=3059524 RepID=UPI00273780C6|nr:TetR family transcriptional regulator [Acidovorax sp. A1169]MDP4077666.1 TetR family transcriptional regulator [Acidovorax sp. A1169]
MTPALASPADDPSPPALSPIDPQATRTRLIEEAMHLMAREGMNAVSLRRIVIAAGAQNPSALHYHFGGRDELIEAITNFLQQWLEPRACARLEALAHQPGYTVRDVVEAAFGPVIAMLSEPALGRDAVNFIGRLGWDYGEKGQEISAALHRRTLELTLARLQALMPAVGRETIQFRLLLTMNAVYYGISYRSYMRRSPFGAMELSMPGNEAREQEEFLDYLEAGLLK